MGYRFNIEKMARDSGLSEKIIKRITEEVRREFPKDEMMYELHLMRAIGSEKNKALGLEKRMQKSRKKREGTQPSQAKN